MNNSRLPQRQGLYDPRFEHDSCGVGFVCDIRGRKTHLIVEQGIKVLERLSHRGAVGADPNTGDGAGLLVQLPHDFLKKVCRRAGIELPPQSNYGAGLVFLPQDKSDRAGCMGILERVIAEEGQRLLGWREVPVNASVIGKLARDTAPFMAQVFIERSKSLREQPAFERKLYVIRKQAGKAVSSSAIRQKPFFYITNLSSRTLIYKGLLMPGQLREFFPDLRADSLKSALCLVHSRYSTNTFPTWDLAQPFRFLAHNGEINTIRGNINWMCARERLLSSELFGTDIEKLKPVIRQGGSDSASIDNVFELLVLSGRNLEHAMSMLIPAAWEHNDLMDEKLRDFYRFHACFMEPWDGPAAMAFTDGTSIGATLDRNGLRPARYIITKDGLVVMASEAGVLDIDAGDVTLSGRLEPGKMLFINTEESKMVSDSDIRKHLSHSNPYGKWLKENMVDIDSLAPSAAKVDSSEDILSILKAFGYTREDLNLILKPMAIDGKEPIGSMGNDTPHACLSNKPQLLYNYFKQLFAQVTNPAIDSIREKLVMSLESFIGPEKNILSEEAAHCRKLRVSNPILADKTLEKLRNISINSFKAKTIYTYFDAESGIEGFKQALERICFEAEYAIEQGYSFIILSDYNIDSTSIALPALLATAAVHHHLVRKTIRSQVSIVLESGEPREVHHFALLFGYGADCINPYLAYKAIRHMIDTGLAAIDYKKAEKNYQKALRDGILKILSKMGISTLRSYRGAQIFEALGLSDDVIEQFFTGTISRIGGAGLDTIAEALFERHKDAYPDRGPVRHFLKNGGIYQWKRDGEFHLWNPKSIAALQDACRKNDYSRYREFAELINIQKAHPTTLRSLLQFRKTEPIPVDEVEPAESILKRFATGAMSFGSISALAHETIAIAMNRLGGKSNTGEGGEDPNRFIKLPNGDSRRSAIKQVASGRFGVTINYLVNADEIQIKIAQGAKPGEGGQLPGHKVSEIIARTRYTTPGVTLISPPPHHDIYSIEDLAQLIFDLKHANPNARVSVKLVSEAGVGTVAAGVAKGHADMILISGGDGGTGASPKSSIRYAGLPWELGLSETHQTLVLNNLRSRVRLQTDGQLRTGRDIALASLLGAQEYGVCTAVLVTIGCVMLRHCHLNNCSVGVATQDTLLQKRFQGRPEYIVNYFRFIVRELREIMAALGMRTIDEMVGRTDLLEVNCDFADSKPASIDLSRVLFKPDVKKEKKRPGEKNSLKAPIDEDIISRCEPVFKCNKPLTIELDIKNTDRAVGAMLSGEICRRCGDNILLEDTIRCRFKGTAGQSFGAFLAKGVTFELEGMANDYVGKGISGGRLIIYPDRSAGFAAEDNIIIGNTTFYGAISGEAYIRGRAGERFCIRNSGLCAVIEGIGDHGCEYMTGGRIVVLGSIGRNFAAGMSGGIAYVYDKDNTVKARCNMDMVLIESLREEDKETLHYLLHNHIRYTSSPVAKRIMQNMPEELQNFVKVIPLEYKRILDAVKIEEKLGLTEESDG